MPLSVATANSLYPLAGSDLAYRRWKIRIHDMLAYQCRRIAQQGGWEISDLIRALICLAAAGTFLHIPKSRTFKTRVALHAMSGRRVYSTQLGGTTLVSIHLPKRLAESLALYAGLVGDSKSSLAGNLLEKGLLMYLQAEKSLLDAANKTRPT